MAQCFHQNFWIKTWRHLRICLPHCQAPLPPLQGLSLCCMRDPKIAVQKPMSATAFSSMLSASQVSGIGEQEIKKHLKAHLGTGFCSTQQSMSMLSEGHGVVNYGSIEFTYEGKQQKDFIEQTEKSIDEEIARDLQCHLQSKPANPSNVQRVQVVVGGNH
jgi:hypothetical protein